MIVAAHFTCVLANDGIGVAKKRPTNWYKKVKTGTLQQRINELESGSTLYLKKGIYEGPIHLDRPGLSLVAEKGAVITGKQQGSVVVVEADGVTIDGFTIRSSGKSYDQTDAGISLRSATNVEITNNRIEDCLFGIDAHSGNNLTVKNNVIRSKDIEIGLRGDAIRLWNIDEATILENNWSYSRDAVIWYSKNIILKDNKGSHSRYSVHSMYSHNIKIQNNNFSKNQVGIFLMYGSDFLVYGNKISRSLGPTGMGIGVKESSNILVQNNMINYSSIGMLMDNSPYKPNTRSRVIGNTLSFNGRAILLSNDMPGGEFRKNRFVGNLEDVTTENRNGSQGVWDQNYWDAYIGFDEDDNGVGDQAFVIEKSEEGFTEDYPDAGIFYGSPLFVLVNLIKKVINIGKPEVILIDESPQLSKSKL